MKIILHKSFGQIEIETADDKEAIAQASFWSELPEECPECGANLFLQYRETKDKGFKYYELHCRGDVTHRTQFGQHTAGGLFYKREWELRPRHHLPPTVADCEEFDREQERRDAEWKSPAPEQDLPDEIANDPQIKVAFDAIKSRLGTPWRIKPDEPRDDYLARLRRQYKQILEMQSREANR